MKNFHSERGGERETMFRFGSIFLASVYSLLIKICGLIYKYVYRSKSSSCVEEKNGSDFLQSELIAKCQVMCSKNVSGFLEEAKTVKLEVQEMFVGSDDVLVRSDSEKNITEFDVESDSFSFHFDLLNGFCSTNQDSHEQVSRVENFDQERREEDHHFKIDQEREDDDDDLDPLCSEEILEGGENLNLKFSEDGIPEEQDISYEVELLPNINSSDQESGNEEILITDDSGNWLSDFLDQERREDLPKERDFDHNLFDDLDDEYIELENLSFKLTHIDKESTSCHDSNKADGESQEAPTTFQQQETSCWDEDEPDVLSEHQNLVQQMKVELKACRMIKGLPTISEECESPKILEDLKPLVIDHKIEYKDIMEEIQKFHKIFSEKMRKLDILSCQTLHAISFLHLKDSEVFTAGKKKVDSVPSLLPKIWQRKVQRIYADPTHKSVTEMHRDLELVYVGQLCLSWEILSWLYVKARQLLDYGCEGNHSYNRAAEEFQQFQVVMQRFMEDEPFQQHRNRGYVRSLLQVPIIRDDCLMIKKERREESDAVSLEMLVEIIRQSMLIFREFLFADKKSTNVASKIDLQDLGNSELLSDIISNLQKKERRTKDNIRSRKCVVKKLKGRQDWRLDREMLTCEVELRLVVRALNMSRLTTDQLVWCRKKVENISFVGRKVHIEPSFLLFPC
ncbi:hypothetical protein ACS0TY_008944 [Phlomoides rotata]